MMKKIFGKELLRLWMQMCAVCLLVIFAAGAGNSSDRFNDLGHKLMCTCGCSQVLLECNHLGCQSLADMSTQLHTAIANGDTDTVILDAFAAKYGPTVFSTPRGGGFNRMAWIVPPVVILLAALLSALLIRRWRMRDVPAPASAPTPDTDAMRARIRKDTEDFL